jgi:miniconductance mechanosensitive channel
MLNIRHYIYDLLIEKGIPEDTAKYLNMLALLLALLLVAFIIDFITKRILWRFSNGLAKHTKTNFDDILIKNKLPRNIAHIIPLLILIEFVPQVFLDFQYAENIIEKTLKIIAIVLTLQIIRSLLG